MLHANLFFLLVWLHFVSSCIGPALFLYDMTFLVIHLVSIWEILMPNKAKLGFLDCLAQDAVISQSGFVYRIDQRCVNQSNALHGPIEFNTEFFISGLGANSKLLYPRLNIVNKYNRRKLCHVPT